MKLLIFIVIFINAYLLNCSNMPKFLKCLDSSCNETISTGRVLKSISPDFGNLKNIKSYEKVNIKGKNYDKDNTLWLVEYKESYGFIDLSFVKENTNNVKSDLKVFKNPHNPVMGSDRTEDENDVSDVSSSKNENKHDTSIIDDETENFTEESESEIHDESKYINDAKSNKNDNNTVLNETIKIDKTNNSLNIANNNTESKEQSNHFSQSNFTKQVGEDSGIDNVNKVKDITKTVKDTEAKTEQASQSNEKIHKFKESENIQKETLQNQKPKENSQQKNTKEILDGKSLSGDDGSIKTSDSNVKIQDFQRSEPDEKTLNEHKSSHLDKEENLIVENQLKMNLNKIPNSQKHVLEKTKIDNFEIKEMKMQPINNNLIKSQESIKSDKTEQPIHEKEDTEKFSDEKKTSGEQFNDKGKEEQKIDNNKLDLKMENKIERNSEKEKKIDSKIGKIKDQLEIPASVQRETVSEKIVQGMESIKKSHERSEINQNTKSIPNDNTAISEKPIRQHTEEKVNESDIMKETLNGKIPTVNLDSMTIGKSQDPQSVESINNDPWLDNNAKIGLDHNREWKNVYRSPIIKLIVKLDLLLQFLLKSVTEKMGFDSSSKINQISNKWFQMSLENLLLILILFASLFLFVYTPKIFKFNRDWQSEFRRQADIVNELETKLQSIEQVRHKLTVQNHNFEKVIDDYKQQIIEIQEDAKKNKKTVMMEIDRMKKAHESNVKALTNDLVNRNHQFQLMESDLAHKMSMIETLEEEKKNMEAQLEDETSQLEETVTKIQEQLKKANNSSEDLKKSLYQKTVEHEKLLIDIEQLQFDLEAKNEMIIKLEKTFENLKSYEHLSIDEFNKQKEIGMELSAAKDQLGQTLTEIEKLSFELNEKNERIVKLEEFASEMEKKQNESDRKRADAVASQEAAEVKLKVLSDYFKSKEVEMAQTLGHKVIETNQSMEEVDCLKHKIQLVESENEDMSKTILLLKSEIKEAQLFAAKCKNDANEQVNTLYLKNNNLERSLIAEKDENKKLRNKLSHYVGPTPPRGINPGFNNNIKDRPSSRQSITSDSSGFVPIPQLLPISFLPQTPTQNSHFSGRNSTNSKKSSNT